MKVALDAMGAERGISTVIEASIMAIEENPDIQIILIGKKERIEGEIERMNLQHVPFSTPQED